ncbi:hypothetical protein [Nonomuraea sp. SBT364]|uniref:hypothetical protein n=1 Tax=Nonomuraea sp. SBT364 TaxID=1580530 RepID=UPI00066A91EE|nr:hypothetical protein [Nonomuraea sp. SBT364]
MGTDRGVNLSRSAIKAARTDLIEALALLRPDSAQGENGRVQPVLAQGGAVDRLNTDADALMGFWPAAFGFLNSTRNGVNSVSTTYDNIVTQVESMIELLTQALRNYDNAEGAGEGAERTAQV